MATDDNVKLWLLNAEHKRVLAEKIIRWARQQGIDQLKLDEWNKLSLEEAEERLRKELEK